MSKDIVSTNQKDSKYPNRSQIQRQKKAERLAAKKAKKLADQRRAGSQPIAQQRLEEYQREKRGKSQQKESQRELQEAQKLATAANLHPQARYSLYGLSVTPNGDGTYKVTETDLVTGASTTIRRCSEKLAQRLAAASQIMIEGGAK